MTEDGYKAYVWYPVEEDTAIEGDEFLQMLNARGWLYTVVVWNKLYRASLIKDRLFPLLSVGEDSAWSPCILSYADRICYLNDYSYEYDRIVNSSTLTDKWRENISEDRRFMSYKNVLYFYLENGNPERINRLKQLAKQDLANARRVYADDVYERLWQQIDEFL